MTGTWIPKENDMDIELQPDGPATRMKAGEVLARQQELYAFMRGLREAVIRRHEAAVAAARAEFIASGTSTLRTDAEGNVTHVPVNEWRGLTTQSMGRVVDDVTVAQMVAATAAVDRSLAVQPINGRPNAIICGNTIIPEGAMVACGAFDLALEPPTFNQIRWVPAPPEAEPPAEQSSAVLEPAANRAEASAAVTESAALPATSGLGTVAAGDFRPGAWKTAAWGSAE